MSTLIRRIIFLTGFVWCSLLFIGKAANSKTHFGTGATVLIPAHSDIYLVGAHLSPNGSYVAALQANTTNTDRGVYRDLWTTASMDVNGEVTRPKVQQSAELMTDVDHEGLKAVMAFSPDEKYLGVLLPQRLMLLTLPDLRQAGSVSLPEIQRIDRLKWSNDSQFLAALDRNQISVWEIASKKIYNREFLHAYDEIQWFNDNWLLMTLSNFNNSNDFEICTLQLEICRAYGSTGIIKAVDTTRNQLIAHGFDGISQKLPSLAVRWSEENDGTFVLDKNAYSDFSGKFFPTKFSPSGKYVAGYTKNDYLFGRVIWDYEKLTPVQITPDKLAFDPVWLGGDKTFAIWNKIYQVGQDEYIDYLDWHHIKGLEDIDSFMVADKAFFEASLDGSWLLYNLGDAALLVPIIF